MIDRSSLVDKQYVEYITIKVKKLHKDATLPVYAHDGDVCADICALEDIVLYPFDRILVPTGLAFELPVGYELQVRPRSGLVINKGIIVGNSPGTIDNGYRGELKVILINTSPNIFEIHKGDRIAQIKPEQYKLGFWKEVDELSNTDRGDNGFGSSGTNIQTK